MDQAREQISTSEVLQEYLDVSENMRHFGNMRFAQMSILIAITGGLIAVLFANDHKLEQGLALALKVGGLMVSAFYLIMETSNVEYWKHFHRLACELETTLRFRQHSTVKRPRTLNSRNSVRGLHFVIIGFWILAITRHLLGFDL